MPKKAGKRSGTATRTRTKRKSAGKARIKKPDAAHKNSASERFVKDLLVRGEATKLDEEGKLPLDATHAVTKEDKDGSVEVRRARFKYY